MADDKDGTINIAPLELINHMKGDILAAKIAGSQLVIEGPALDALLSVVEVAEQLTRLRAEADQGEGEEPKVILIGEGEESS